ncbi:hypothetical protein DXG01_005612, partial [Tephrocybe rancida]
MLYYLNSGKVQPHVHDSYLRVRRGAYSALFRVFYKRHICLPKNPHIPPIRGDMVIMKVSARNQESVVNLGSYDGSLVDQALPMHMTISSWNVLQSCPEERSAATLRIIKLRWRLKMGTLRPIDDCALNFHSPIYNSPAMNEDFPMTDEQPAGHKRTKRSEKDANNSDEVSYLAIEYVLVLIAINQTYDTADEDGGDDGYNTETDGRQHIVVDAKRRAVEGPSRQEYKKLVDTERYHQEMATQARRGKSQKGAELQAAQQAHLEAQAHIKSLEDRLAQQTNEYDTKFHELTQQMKVVYDNEVAAVNKKNELVQQEKELEADLRRQREEELVQRSNEVTALRQQLTQTRSSATQTRPSNVASQTEPSNAAQAGPASAVPRVGPPDAAAPQDVLSNAAPQAGSSHPSQPDPLAHPPSRGGDPIARPAGQASASFPSAPPALIPQFVSPHVRRERYQHINARRSPGTPLPLTPLRLPPPRDAPAQAPSGNDIGTGTGDLSALNVEQFTQLITKVLGDLGIIQGTHTRVKKSYVSRKRAKEALAIRTQKATMSREYDEMWKYHQDAVREIWRNTYETTLMSDFITYEPAPEDEVAEVNRGVSAPQGWQLDFSKGWENSRWNELILDKLYRLVLSTRDLHGGWSVPDVSEGYLKGLLRGQLKRAREAWAEVQPRFSMETGELEEDDEVESRVKQAYAFRQAKSSSRARRLR